MAHDESQAQVLTSLPTVLDVDTPDRVIGRSETRRAHRSEILVVGAHEEARRQLVDALTRHGHHVRIATSSHEAIVTAMDRAFDLLLLEQQLPEIDAIALVRRLRRERQAPRFALVGHSLNVDITVEAMKLGALDVLEMPISETRLLAVVGAAAAGPTHAGAVPWMQSFPANSLPAMVPPRSIAERWATYVLAACGADGDLKTLKQWARVAAVSNTTLCESCRLLGIQPHAARDLTRALRAAIQAPRHQCRPEILLDFSDTRSLKMFLQRAGAGFEGFSTHSSVARFLAGQRFIMRDNEALDVLFALLVRARPSTPVDRSMDIPSNRPCPRR